MEVLDRSGASAYTLTMSKATVRRYSVQFVVVVAFFITSLIAANVIASAPAAETKDLKG